MGMLLRDSKLKGTATYASTLALLRDCQSITGNPYKEEFLYLVTLLDRQEEVKP
jgi:Ca-activated chloride channel family protein